MQNQRLPGTLLGTGIRTGRQKLFQPLLNPGSLGFKVRVDVEAARSINGSSTDDEDSKNRLIPGLLLFGAALGSRRTKSGDLIRRFRNPGCGGWPLNYSEPLPAGKCHAVPAESGNGLCTCPPLIYPVAVAPRTQKCLLWSHIPCLSD